MKRRIASWKDLAVGDKVRYRANDFDGITAVDGIVADVAKDHVLVFAGDMALWVDEDTEEFFSKSCSCVGG